MARGRGCVVDDLATHGSAMNMGMDGEVRSTSRPSITRESTAQSRDRAARALGGGAALSCLAASASPAAACAALHRAGAQRAHQAGPGAVQYVPAGGAGVGGIVRLGHTPEAPQMVRVRTEEHHAHTAPTLHTHNTHKTHTHIHVIGFALFKYLSKNNSATHRCITSLCTLTAHVNGHVRRTAVCSCDNVRRTAVQCVK